MPTKHDHKPGLFDAGHCHACAFEGGLQALVRATLFAAPVLVALGFSLLVVSSRAERPNGLIGLVYLGGLSLAVPSAPPTPTPSRCPAPSRPSRIVSPPNPRVEPLVVRGHHASASAPW